jgi:hypothetical protein
MSLIHSSSFKRSYRFKRLYPRPPFTPETWWRLLPMIWMIFIAGPYLVIYRWPWLLPKAFDLLFILLSTRSGPILISVVVSIFSIVLFLLKLKLQPIYGAFEVFFSQLTIYTAIFTPVAEDKKTGTLLTLFSGIYIAIRGLTNVQEGLKKRKDQDLLNIEKELNELRNVRENNRKLQDLFNLALERQRNLEKKDQDLWKVEEELNEELRRCKEFPYQWDNWFAENVVVAKMLFTALAFILCALGATLNEYYGPVLAYIYGLVLMVAGIFISVPKKGPPL